MSKKGPSYEREICVILSNWWNKTPDVFWRTPGSGAMAKTKQRKGLSSHKNLSGDIGAIDPCGEPFIRNVTVEIKRGYSNDNIHACLDRPLNGKASKFEEWIDQVEESRTYSNAAWWILIHKRDRREPLVFMSLKLYHYLMERCTAVPVLRFNCAFQGKGRTIRFGMLSLGFWVKYVDPKIFMEYDKHRLIDEVISKTKKVKGGK
jgi:hypothetical protein